MVLIAFFGCRGIVVLYAVNHESRIMARKNMTNILRDAREIHMIGITGQGMTALAELLVAEGAHVTGSDTSEVFQTNAVLEKLGIRVFPFQKKNITKRVDLVVRSSAYGGTHMEVVAARRLHIPVIDYIDAVAELFNRKRGILVTGTHGKTSTTAMIGLMLEQAGFDPTVLVGATVRAWGKNARAGHSPWMVAEGDEYQNKFLKLRPHIAVVTSIEYDHPDFFITRKQYEDAFRAFVSGLPADGLLVAERGLKRILKKIPCRAAWYGLPGKMEGRHMELNKKAALLVARHLRIPLKKAKQSLDGYEGTSRRMEFYTSPSADIVVLDDYAHHPTEIRTTLAAVRRQYPKRVITALFQPHTYTRTYVLLSDFAQSFKDADEVIVLPIYSSAREQKKDFQKDLARQLSRKVGSYLAKSFADAIYFCRLLPLAKQKRVFITLGAGDGWKIAKAMAI